MLQTDIIFNYLTVVILFVFVKNSHETSIFTTSNGGSGTSLQESVSSTGNGADSAVVSNDYDDSNSSNDVFDQISTINGQNEGSSPQSVIVRQQSGPDGSTSKVIVTQNGVTKTYDFDSGSPDTVQVTEDDDNNELIQCFENFFLRMAEAAATFFF